MKTSNGAIVGRTAIASTGIQRTDKSPIQLELGLLPRNWEGIVRLDNRGFLLVTDQYPVTILAFVPSP